MGIEPTCAAWKAAVLPLNYTRFRRATGIGGGRWQQHNARPRLVNWLCGPSRAAGAVLGFFGRKFFVSLRRRIRLKDTGESH